MKAVVFNQYGPPEVLQLKTIDKPVPKDHEIQVKIIATAVNSADWRLRKADPFLVRLFLGFTRPKKNILGSVLAGKVEAVGKSVKRFKPGDLVYGTSRMQLGTYAEYICLPEDALLTTKPEGASFEAAAALFFGGHTALYFLRKAGIQPGQKVLIYGASGSTGTYAVQLARYFGAEVTGVCSTANVDMVKSLGADFVVDYKKENFAERKILYDVIFDTVGKSVFFDCVKSLRENGVYLRAVHMSAKALLYGLWTTMSSRKKVIGGSAEETQEVLDFLDKLFSEKKLIPVIDKIYPLEQIVDAHRYVEKGHKKGNVIIKI